MYCTLKMSPRPFPLLRINSLFHLLRIATAAEACSDRVRDKKTAITKKCQLKVSIPKNSTQIINYQLLLFPLHSVAASRRSLLCPSWDVNIAGDASSPGTILILWLGRVVNPTEWNWYCTIWKVWPIVPDHCEHWKQSLAWLVSFFFIVRLTVLQSIEAQQIKCNSSQLIIGSQNRLTFSSLLFPTKKCSHVLQ